MTLFYGQRRSHRHIGGCERCGERTETTRYRDDGVAFRALPVDISGGFWLCRPCLNELERARPRQDAAKVSSDEERNKKIVEFDQDMNPVGYSNDEP